MKKLLLALAMFGIGGSAVAVANAPINMVRAEGEDSSTTSEVVETTEEEENTVSDWLKDKYETFIVPAFAGVSVASVISVIVSVAFAILNRKTNVKIKASNEETVDVALKIVNLASDIIETARVGNAISADSKKAFLEKADEITMKIAEMTEQTEKMLEIKELVILMSRVITEMAKVDENAVTSGVAKELAKLDKQIQKMM